MTDNGFGQRSNKLLIRPINAGINRCTDFHWRINSAGARSANGAGVPLTFVSGGRFASVSSPARNPATQAVVYAFFVYFGQLWLFNSTELLQLFFLSSFRAIFIVTDCCIDFKTQCRWYTNRLMRLHTALQSNVSLNNLTASLPSNEWMSRRSTTKFG